VSDKQTTESLRKVLTERGIEWRSGLEGVTFVGDWCFVEYDNGKLAATCEPVLTHEQAIAATLGADEPNDECFLMYDGKKYPATLDFGFLGMMPITITVGGFRYLVEVPE
jgi:hypothetical protein